MLFNAGKSLSARRAWIEMAVLELIPLTDPVALRKESVDRNPLSLGHSYIRRQSLSARRAWIEIFALLYSTTEISVALRKESVDRNTNPGSTTLTFPVALRKESVDRNARSSPC